MVATGSSWRHQSEVTGYLNTHLNVPLLQHFPTTRRFDEEGLFLLRHFHCYRSRRKGRQRVRQGDVLPCWEPLRPPRFLSFLFVLGPNARTYILRTKRSAEAAVTRQVGQGWRRSSKHQTASPLSSRSEEAPSRGGHQRIISSLAAETIHTAAGASIRPVTQDLL